MPGQNARTAEFLLHKINDTELKLWETLYKKLSGILSWHFAIEFFVSFKRRLSKRLANAHLDVLNFDALNSVKHFSFFSAVEVR